MINCIIIDDEPLARKGLKEYIADVDFLYLTGEFENPLKAMDTLTRQEIDLIFLDIQMPKITGLEFLKTMSRIPMVVLTTAYPQYALEGFELNVMDYLLKPFSFERFWKAVVKVKVQLESKKSSQDISTNDSYFFIKSDNKLVRIHYDDILYIEALQNYVAVHTEEKKLISYLTFKSVEDHLPRDRFLKIHKSFIVSLSKIDSIEGNELRIGSRFLPISRSFKEAVLEKILRNRYLKR